MTEPSDRAAHLDSRSDIHDLLVRYATGIDQRDWELFRSCFTEDCDADYGAIGSWTSADAITEWMREAHEPCGHTVHRITNQSVVVEGDHATARSYVDAIVLGDDDLTGTQATGVYDDELVRSGEGDWRIARRRFTPVLVRTIPDGQVLSLDG